MRLYLSSFRMGNKPEELVHLADGKKAAIIANATDFKDTADRAASVQLEIDNLSSLGFISDEVDLRDYFGRQGELADMLSKFDVIWVRGGNVFILRRALKISGCDEILRNLLVNDKIAYGGYSAGIDILQPHLHGIELVDDPHLIPEGYEEEVIWDCLGLLPYCVAPHYKSDHPESSDVDKSVEYMIDNHIPFVALRDGQAIVINGYQQKIVE